MKFAPAALLFCCLAVSLLGELRATAATGGGSPVLAPIADQQLMSGDSLALRVAATASGDVSINVEPLTGWAPEIVEVGDPSHDGQSDAIDAALVLQYVVRLLRQIDEPAGDVNGDGRVNAVDALLILQDGAGLLDINKAVLRGTPPVGIHRLQITVVAKDGTRSASQEIEVEVIDPRAPAAPENFLVDVMHTFATLTWTNVATDATGSELRIRRQDTGALIRTIDLSATDLESYRVSLLPPLTRLIFELRASRDSDGERIYSKAARFKLETGEAIVHPEAPKNLQLTLLPSLTEIQVTWQNNNVTDHDGFRILAHNTQTTDFIEELGIFQPDLTKVTLVGLTPGLWVVEVWTFKIYEGPFLIVLSDVARAQIPVPSPEPTAVPDMATPYARAAVSSGSDEIAPPARSAGRTRDIAPVGWLDSPAGLSAEVLRPEGRPA